jgi:hypothetical protein
MIKLEQQQQQQQQKNNKNQQFKKIENAFNSFANFQTNKNNKSDKNIAPNEQKDKRISQFIYLFFTYSWAFVQINALVVRLIFQYFLGLIFKNEKSVTNEIVLITGAGGYLGEISNDFFLHFLTSNKLSDVHFIFRKKFEFRICETWRNFSLVGH